jgi:hypothetical protein
MKHETKPGWKPWRPPPPQDDRWTRWGFRGMTVRDWLDLLIVPVMLALFAGFFTTVQAFWQTAAEDARQQALANQTAKIQRFVEEFRVQEASLQQYLDLMTNLLIKNSLRISEEGSEVRAIAQAQTLTTLRKMDPQGKRTVVLFLSDAGLIQRSLGDTTEPIVKLSEADLSEADLRGADLSDANLNGAQGVTEEELEERAKTLEGANMPDGSKHP